MADMVGTRTISGVRKSKALNTGNQVKGTAMLLVLHSVCVCVCVCVSVCRPITAFTEQL